MPIADFIEWQGIPFKISRGNSQVATAQGLKNYDKTKRMDCAQFYPNTDIKVGDTLTMPDGKTVYVCDTDVLYWDGKAEALTAFYTTNPVASPEPTVTVFNIGSVNNSVVGNNNHVTMTIQEMRAKAAQEGGADKEELQEIISILEKLVSGQEPPKKGLLARFSGSMERNSWITNAIASAIIGWLL